MIKLETEFKFPKESFSSHVVMVRPFRFYCNQQTVLDNIYQIQTQQNIEQISNRALLQFDLFVQKLRQNHIVVTVVQDDGKNTTPDSIYPNNWISFHFYHKVVLYPMYAPNRRKQRQIPILQILQKQFSQKFQILQDYTLYEFEGIFLEGTGSLVLDRQNKIAYAVISQRTNLILLQKFCTDLQYQLCFFKASQYSQIKKLKVPIYHTNVLMSLSRHFAFICFDLIQTTEERNQVRKSILQASKKEIFELSQRQISQFTANSITLTNKKGEDLLVLSDRAYNCLSQEQKNKICKRLKIVHSNLQTIQKNGGGSARCMITEIY